MLLFTVAELQKKKPNGKNKKVRPLNNACIQSALRLFHSPSLIRFMKKKKKTELDFIRIVLAVSVSVSAACIGMM